MGENVTFVSSITTHNKSCSHGAVPTESRYYSFPEKSYNNCEKEN
jgi:hypothetical protein